jgi:RNA polymerase sigma factor (sigma-70 family)
MDHAIQTFGGQPSPLTRGLAKQVTLDAMKTFDPKGGASFKSWAQTQYQRLARPIRSTKFTMRVPEMRAREAHRVRGIISELEAETGFEPSDGEISEKLGIPLHRVQVARRSTAPEVVSNDLDTTQNHSPNEDSKLIHDMVYYSLPPKDQVIMEYIFGYNGVKPKSGIDVAQKLRITPAAVSQRVAKIRAMLQQAEEVSNGPV